MPYRRHLVVASCVACLPLWLASSPLFAQGASQVQTSALINEQLDRPIDIQLTSTPLPNVLKQIEQQTGVPIRVRSDVYDILPYGQNTPITATIQNLPLRQALDVMGQKLGLLFVLEAQAIELRPVEALTRLGRRVTVQELRTLDVLKTTPLTGAGDSPTVKQLAAAVDARLAELDETARKAGRVVTPIVLELRPDAASTEEQVIRLARNATLADALEEISRQSTLSWYPWGDSVVVAPRTAIYRALLDRVVSVRYDGVDVSQVLLDLSQKAGIEFTIQPGAIQRIPPEARNVRLLVDAPIRQALESLAGFTGLGYVVNDKGVYIWNDQWNTQVNPAAARGRVVGTIPIDGMEVFIYDDMLSDELRAKIDGTLKDTLNAMRVKAATQPANEHHAN
jgi:hypothetical protein